MLKVFFSICIALSGLLFIASRVNARDDKLLLPIADVLNGPDARKKLDSSIKFFFGNQPHPKIFTNFQSDVPISKQTRSTRPIKGLVNGFFYRLFCHSKNEPSSWAQMQLSTSSAITGKSRCLAIHSTNGTPAL